MLTWLFVAGCGAGTEEPAGLVGQPTQKPSVDVSVEPTSLATEPVNPTNLVSPSAASSSAPGNYYKPPGWDGSSDVDCGDFDSHEHAQSFFIGTGGSTTNDPYRLDQDHDGNACETLP